MMQRLGAGEVQQSSRREVAPRELSYLTKGPVLEAVRGWSKAATETVARRAAGTRPH